MGVDMLFILLLALILFGPKRLPEIARQVGKFVAEFKRASNDFKYQLQAEIDKAGVSSTPETGVPETTPQQNSSSIPTLLPPAETPVSSNPAPSAESEHERLMRTARMAYQAQAFNLRPPEPPPVAHADRPLAAEAPSPDQPVSVPPTASPEPAGDSAGHGSQIRHGS